MPKLGPVGSSINNPKQQPVSIQHAFSEEQVEGTDEVTAFHKSQADISQPTGTAFRESQGETAPTLAKVKELFNKNYYFSDDNIIDVVLGVVAGNHFANDPIWLYIISPPSGGKTELLLSIFDCDETLFLSDLTPSSLISGYKEPSENALQAKLPTDDTPPAEHVSDADMLLPEGSVSRDFSLLPQLDGKVLVTKDFTVIHDKPSETRSQIYAILRDVYDGYASRAVGNSGVKGYHSRFNYLAGMTPEIEKSWSLNTLGERFLMYRIAIKDRREHARQALNNIRMRPKINEKIDARKSIQVIVKAFLAGIPRYEPSTDDEMGERILDLAEILSTSRTYVPHERNGEILHVPQPELATRVAKQLLRVGMSVALVRGRESVTSDEFEVMKRVALDSLPLNRRMLLAAFWKEKGKWIDLERLTSHLLRMSTATVRREINALVVLGIVAREDRQKSSFGIHRSHGQQGKRETKTIKAHYMLNNNFAELFNRIGGV